MTIRTLIASAAICCITTLTGCATKEAAKMNNAAPSTAIQTTTDAEPKAGVDKTQDRINNDAVLTESSPNSGGAIQSTDKAGSAAGLTAVYFDFDSYLLTTEARETLSRNANWLTENQLLKVVIEGHADERGSDEYNLALSEKRALAAQRYLDTLGVKSDRMESVGYGEEKPALQGHDDGTFAKNRRVEFVIAK